MAAETLCADPDVFFLAEIGVVLSTHVLWRSPPAGGAVTGTGE